MLVVGMICCAISRTDAAQFIITYPTPTAADPCMRIVLLNETCFPKLRYTCNGQVTYIPFNTTSDMLLFSACATECAPTTLTAYCSGKPNTQLSIAVDPATTPCACPKWTLQAVTCQLAQLTLHTTSRATLFTGETALQMGPNTTWNTPVSMPTDIWYVPTDGCRPLHLLNTTFRFCDPPTSYTNGTINPVAPLEQFSLQAAFDASGISSIMPWMCMSAAFSLLLLGYGSDSPTCALYGAIFTAAAHQATTMAKVAPETMAAANSIVAAFTSIVACLYLIGKWQTNGLTIPHKNAFENTCLFVAFWATTIACDMIIPH